MAKVNYDSLVDLVRRSGLVEESQLARVLAEMTPPAAGNEGAPPASPPEAEALADRIVAENLVTRWQADRLLEGRYRGFSLGKYRLLDHLGRGGMSTVYLAEHTLMQRRVAIKVLPKERVEDSSYLARFYREAQAAASLDHRNIVRAYDVDNDNGVHYLVMEYVEGRDLQQTVKQEGPLEYDKAAEFIRQAAVGLSHAHEAGLIHRDIKPANLLVDLKNTVKILDLGLARFTADQQASLTVAYDENVLGTADYLAPEQAIDSHGVDARADIYSLGCSLYYLLTGHPPFAEGTLPQRLMMHQKQPPPSIHLDRPDAPQDLVDICLKMMAKKPAVRYQTARDVAHALGDWLEARGHAVPPDSSIGKRAAGPAPEQVRGGARQVAANAGGAGGSGVKHPKVVIPQDKDLEDEYRLLDDLDVIGGANADTVSNLDQQTIKGAAKRRPAEPPLGRPAGQPGAGPIQKAQPGAKPVQTAPKAGGPASSGPQRVTPHPQTPRAPGSPAQGPATSGGHRAAPQGRPAGGAQQPGGPAQSGGMRVAGQLGPMKAATQSGGMRPTGKSGPMKTTGQSGPMTPLNTSGSMRAVQPPAAGSADDSQSKARVVASQLMDLLERKAETPPWLWKAVLGGVIAAVVLLMLLIMLYS
ncbi:MAG: protein kinase domain-containing protein [Planctomycetota bacterium]